MPIPIIMRRHYNNLKNGFTLIEMAIVLMIVGLLLGGILVPLGSQIEQRKNSDTQKALAEIQEALIGYTLAYGRLPCPSDPSTTPGTSRATCTTAADSTGILPWITLGVGETDAWGNRYTYRVTSAFADAISDATYTSGCTSPDPSPAPTQASFALCSVGNLTVLSAATGGVTIANNVPAVVISHGKQAAGAYTTTSSSQTPVGSNPDEKANSDGSANLNYVSHPPTTTFDDLLVWISPNILRNRMVAAGKLP